MVVEGGRVLKLSGAKAGADLSAAAKQYTFMKLSADLTVVQCSGITDKPIGVLQAPCANAAEADVLVIGITPVQADASITAGDPISTSADGQAQTAVATQFVVGAAVNIASGTSAGNLITAAINCASPSIKA